MRLRAVVALGVILAMALAGFAATNSIGYVPTYIGQTVVVYDSATNSIVTTLTGFSNPLGVGIKPDGSEAYITEYTGSGNVKVIKTATNAVVATIPIGGYPWTAVFSKDGSRAYVSNASGTALQVINTSTQTVVSSIALQPTLGMALSPDGSKLYVAQFTGGAAIHVIDTATNTVSASYPATGCPSDVEVSPDGSKLYTSNICNSDVQVLNAATGATIATIPASAINYSLALSSDGAKLYVPNFISNYVTVIDTASNSVSSTITVPGNQPSGIAFTTDGTKMLVTHPNGIGSSELIDAATHSVTSGPTFGPLGDTYPYMMGNPFVPRLTNRDPVCSAALPSTATVWPPNHKMEPVTLKGVTDPDGDAVSLSVKRIFQDEPVNAPGDGNTGPDGAGVGTSTAQVRAERSGTGDGRVYHVTFRAEDGKGGACDATVKVAVPHSQNKPAVDGGALYNSTIP